MRRYFLAIVVVLGIILAAAPVWFLASFILFPFGTAEIVQSRDPLSLNDAKRLTGLPLPDSAKNIRYAKFHQWIAYEAFVRFEAPKHDCVAFAESIISEAGEERPGTIAIALKRFADADPRIRTPTSSHLDIQWFDVGLIQDGLAADGNPQVWVDLKRGLCYYWQHD